MTISTESYELSFAGSGTTGPFAVTFPVYEAADVKCLKVASTGRRTPFTISVDYTVTLGGGSMPTTASTVTTTANVAAGETLVVYQGRSRLQGMDLPASGKLLNERFEQGLDTATMNHLRRLYDSSFRSDQQKRLSITGVSANVTLTSAESNYAYYKLAGSPGALTDIIFPSGEEHVAYIYNGFGDSSGLRVVAAGGGSTVTIAALSGAWVWSAGNDIEELP